MIQYDGKRWARESVNRCCPFIWYHSGESQEQYGTTAEAENGSPAYQFDFGPDFAGWRARRVGRAFLRDSVSARTDTHSARHPSTRGACIQHIGLNVEIASTMRSLAWFESSKQDEYEESGSFSPAVGFGLGGNHVARNQNVLYS